MAIRNVILLLAPLLVRTGSSHRSFAGPVLVLLTIFLGVAWPASAQTSSQQYVYVSEPNPQAPAAVAGLSKASQTGALSLIQGSPFPERLEGGLLAIDGQGKFLFILNPKSNDISMFQIDQVSGALSEVPGSPFKVPTTINPSLAPSQPLSIATEASGKFLFVGYYLGDIQGESSVVSLAIDTSGPSPVLLTSQSTPLTSGGAPVQLLTDAKGLRLYVGLSAGQNGIAVGGAEVYSINSSTGKLVYQGMADSLSERGQDYAIDPQNRFFFAGGHGNYGNLESCNISPVDGTTTTCSPQLSLGFQIFPGAMVAENSGHFLYVEQSGGVVAYSFDQVTGALTQVGPLSGIIFPTGSVVADPLGPYIYTASGANTGSIHAYQVDQQTGNLTEISGSPFSIGATPVGCCGGLAISGSPVQAVSGPSATLFPSTAMPFGAAVGTTSPTQVFSIVNVGNQLLAFTSNPITITGTNPSSFSQTNTCPATLAPNANCSVSLNFAPASVGTFAANLQVADNAPGSPQSLALTGTGVAPVPAVTFSPSVPSFPATTEGTSSAPQPLTVISSGNAPLHVSSVSLGGPNLSDFSFTNNCTAPVAPTANCTILLVFSPIGPGQRTANLVISDDVSGSPQKISLSATANPAFIPGPAPGGSTSASISAGQTAQFQLQLTPGPGFTGTVSLTCSGAPLGAVCHVPATVPLANGVAAPFTVTVSTSGGTLLPPAIPKRIVPPGVLPILFLVVLAMVLLGTIKNVGKFAAAPRARRLAWSSALAAVFLCTVIYAAGCGATGAPVATVPPPIVTPPGTSTITLSPTAMSSTGQPLQLQPIQLTLTVN